MFANQRQGVAVRAGTGEASTGTVVLANSNNVTFGGSLSASSMVITGSVPTPGPAAISAGTLSADGQVVLSNSNWFSFGMNGQTVTAKFGTLSHWVNVVSQIINGNTNNSSSKLGFQRVSFGAPISVSRIDSPIFLSGGSVLNTTFSASLSIGIYTMGGSTMSLASSALLTTTLANNTAVATSISRLMSITATAAWNVTPGAYMLATVMSLNPAATANGLGNQITALAAPGGGNYSKYFAAGQYTVGTLGLPNSVQLSEINQTNNNTGVAAQLVFAQHVRLFA